MGLYELKMHLKRNPLVKKMVDKSKQKRMDQVENSRREALQNEGGSLVQIVEEVLEKSGFKFFINFGNLLGLTREGRFMKHDNDLDYGIYISSADEWARLETMFVEAGLKKTKQFVFKGEITEQTYEKGGLSVDFFQCFEDDEYLHTNIYFRKEGYIYHSANEFHVSCLNMYKFKGIKKALIGDQEYHIPDEPEKYLESIYTADWRIPNPNWVAELGPSWNELEGEIALVEYVK